MNYNGKIFIHQKNTENREVDAETTLKKGKDVHNGKGEN